MESNSKIEKSQAWWWMKIMESRWASLRAREQKCIAPEWKSMMLWRRPREWNDRFWKKSKPLHSMTFMIVLLWIIAPSPGHKIRFGARIMMNVYTIVQSKIALSPFINKRCILDNNVDTAMGSLFNISKHRNYYDSNVQFYQVLCSVEKKLCSKK